MKKLYNSEVFLTAIACVFIASSLCSAVTSKIIRHSRAVDLLKGETKNTVIDSDGTIKLALRTKEIDLEGMLTDSWIINTIVTDAAGAVYLGTSPNGEIIKYSKNKATKI